MAKIAIVTDSTAYLPRELVKEYDIQVIPTKVIFGERIFRDGVNITPDRFYHMLAEAETLPITTQPSVGEFQELYMRLSQEAEAIVSIHISKDLSGTIASAMNARANISGLPIYIIDSRSTSMGLGFVTLAAARAAREGKKLPEVVKAAEDLVPKMNVIFVVDTLEYLRKGGRIGGAAALAGSMLKIKPILYINRGRIEALGRARTRIKARGRLLEIVAERVGSASKVHAAVVHAAAPEEAQTLHDQIARSFDCAELHVAEISPVVGTHVGPGTLGIAFYGER